MKNIYRPLEAVIEDVRQETPSIKTFTLCPREPLSFRTGQFIELTVPGVGEAPFTPSSDPRVTQRFDVTIMNAGKVTAALHELAPGAVVGIRGPYGKGYPLEELRGRDLLIVGGGVGLAPLRSLILSIFGSREQYRSVCVRYGARSPKDIVYRDALPQWAGRGDIDLIASVDAGDPSWQGNVGLVTTILGNLPFDPAPARGIVCGPPIMMKFVTLKLLEIGFKPDGIYLSMEKNMSCGLGKCGHCRIGKYYSCKDGPVFTYEQMKDEHDIWD